ncbi:MAG: methyltransferase domain-containing protein [Rubrivivax sp.]|nr:methyltransferase domain-containing protein [Pseudomonadota bacterium]MCW5637664.1 methyltransferase domain-containing protein [Rubrivivax sp.]HOW48840.1 methyltransferase domain-containing protein [Rubrivivax sp.]HRY88183.1 methyltransferase domain-containing protein [Rubrivivax sp.]
MVAEASSIELDVWLRTPPGQCLLQWEQAQLDAAVADIFGFHAVQLGLAEVQGLRANRMPHRWVLADTAARAEPLPLPQAADEAVDSQPLPAHPAALCDFDALPFPNNSLDLVVLTHTLELARDPHLTLREVERVLVPEGRVIVTGFNPMSLWGLRQRLGRALHLAGRSQPYLPRAGEFLAYRRLRDWLRLLSFEVEGGRFGCWRPPYRSARWLERSAWVERVGERWWPVFGAVYFLVAVKRVRGMRLVGLARREARLTRPAGAIVANRRRQRVASGAE